MYVLLHGAKKNVGDFLIFERSKALLQKHLQTDDFVTLPRWLSVEQKLDIVNQSKAIIWCGGPGYSSTFYPDVLPLVDDLSKIQVPIIPMALGWGVGALANQVDTFRFSAPATQALQSIHKNIQQSSVRDQLTEKVLRNHGVENVVTTGCSAWYSLPHVEQSFEAPKSIKKVVVTTPAGLHLFKEAYQLLVLVKEMFPQAEKHLVFHRGMWPDQHTPIRQALPNIRLAWQGKRLGYNVINAAYSTEHIAFYEHCDLHVGYRVHAHIDFLSFRRPSLLIQEDARGIGQSLTLQTSDVVANQSDTMEYIQMQLDRYVQSNFEDFRQTTAIMQKTYVTMTEFLHTLP